MHENLFIFRWTMAAALGRVFGDRFETVFDESGPGRLLRRKTFYGNTLESRGAAAPNYTGPFIIVTILFGIFGFLTSLNNVLVKKLEDIFNLSHGPADAGDRGVVFRLSGLLGTRLPR